MTEQIIKKDEKIDPIGNPKVKKKVQQFVSLIKENINKVFYICSHDNPDPDSMASCFALAKILNFLGVEHTYIYYCGEISHPQNKSMQVVLDINLKKWNGTAEKAVAESQNPPIFIFADCCNKQKNMSIAYEPHIVIDHHKSSPTGKNILFIHDDVGSCSTLIADLILSLPPNESGDQITHCFDPDSDECKSIATALAIGIKTDTQDFRSENTTDDDYRAYKLLTKHFKDDKFHRIISYELPAYIFDNEQIAWQNKIFTPPTLITGLGFIEESKSDCIPYLADKMMRLQGIQTVLVYAVVNNSIKASVRTISASIDCSHLLAEIFGEGAGGSKSGSGAASVDIPLFNIEEMEKDEKQMFWELTKKTIERKFAKK